MQKVTSLFFVLSILVAGCDTSTWSGVYGATNGIPTATPATGGYATSGNQFHTWSNNAWGNNSTLNGTTANKCHPPMMGTSSCLVDTSANLNYDASTRELPPCLSAPQAVSNAAGEIAFTGIAPGSYHVALKLPGYYGILVPWDGYENMLQPALEMPSYALQNQLYGQLSLPSASANSTKGGISFFAVQGEGVAEDELHVSATGTDACGMVDHHEDNVTAERVWFRYRRVYVSGTGETYGPWRGHNHLFGTDREGSWNTSNGEIVYLNSGESPATTQVGTTSSGLALGINLDPGLYEVEADDLQVDPNLWDCVPVIGSLANAAGRRARTWVAPGFLSDIRFACQVP